MARQVITPNVPPADAAGVDDDVTLDSPTGAHTTQLNELAARGFTRVNDPRQVAPADAALLRGPVKPADAALLYDIANAAMDDVADRGDGIRVIALTAHAAARLRALAEVMEREQRELAHARYVIVANELLPQLTAEWSEPVRVKVQEDDGRVLKLVLKTCDAFGSADLRSAQRGDR